MFKRGKLYNATIATSILTKNMELAVIFNNETAGFKIRRGQLMTQNSFIQFSKTGIIKPSQGKAASRTLKFLARRDGQCVSKEVFILQEPYIGHVFIQVDRPTFMPGEEVKFRVVAFDDDTKPIEMNNIKVVVEDSEGKVAQTFKLTSETDEHEFKSYGLYENTFKIYNHTRDGRWRISTKINDNDILFAEKYFEVSRKEAPLYEIKLDVPKLVFLKKKFINIDISAVFKFGSFAKGIAKLTFTNQHGDELYEERFILDTKIRKSYGIKEDLRVRFNSNSYLLNVGLEFTDDSVGTTQTLNRQVKILQSVAYEISVTKPYKLKENARFQLNVKVKDSFGLTIMDSGRNEMKIEVVYFKKDGDIISTENSVSYIKNFNAIFRLQTPSETEKLDYKVTYLGSEASEIVLKDTSTLPSLRVYIDNE
jgi:MG2 domain